uniref:RRM domain-containing protein n=1 Tax=Solanum lycopersicum TaxID=4081 RepID=A0A3Q7EZ38_SOLLC|nr:nucleolin-like isoform X2 [Solanum lycopersicum]
MRTRSAEKRSAGINQTPPAESKRTPTSRAKQTRNVGSKSSPAAEEAKASDADGAVQSTPVAKSASGRKTTRRAVKKAVKKSPASSKTTSDNTLVSEDAGTAMLEDPVEEKDAKDSKEDHGNEKDAAGSTECVEEGDTEDPKEDYVTEEAALESKESIKEGDTEDTEEVDVKEEDAEDPKEDPVKEKDLQDPKKDTAKPKGAEDLKEDIVKEKVAEDSEENAIKEKNAEESKEDLVMGEAAEDSKEYHVKEKDAEDLKEGISGEEDAENSKENAMKEKDAELKEDLVMGEAAEDSKEYPIEEEGAESSKEDVAKEKDGEELKEDLVREEDAEDSKEYPMMEKNREDSEESAVMEEDAEDSKEDPAKEEDAEDLKENPVMGEDAEDSKEDPVKEKDAEGLNDAGPTPMYETNEKIEESSNNLVSTAKNVGDSVDQNGNKEEHAGDAQGEPALNTIMSLDEVTVAYDVRLSEKIGHDVRTSENQGPAVTYVKSQEPTIEDMKSSDSQELTTTELKCQEGEGSNKGKEGLELRGEKNDGSTPTGDNVKNEQCAEDRMEEDTDRKMKGKDISLDEAGEDKIEDFADEENGEEFVEDDVPEHCEEAETLEDERAQLNALAKERKKRRELEVFVGGLDRDAVEEDLKRVFQHVGEVVDVRMHRELSTNKNKGYAFVKFATKEQVSRALAEMRNPVIRGKRCGTSPSEDNDTLFLGNICNTWTKEAVKQKLKDYGVEAVENINLVADPKREGLSRGFAFLEFSCHTDAMTAYKRLQRPDVVFGHSERTAKIAFAEPLRDPDPEVMAQVKSVFIDGLPPYWNEERVREKFKGFGEITRITLARNISTAKRKDFGFVDFDSHEAAVSCVEGVNNTELGDGNLKAKVRARLSNPQPKTQAVKGGISGGFRISRGPMGRGLPRGGHTLGRANFPRGRGFHPRGPGHGGRMGFTEHEFGSPYPPFRGRSNFGRGGRWNFSGAHPVTSEGPMFVDRMRHGDRGHTDDAFFRRQQFPIEGINRPSMDRHIDDRFSYDNTGHGLKRPFSMTVPNPDYLGPSRRPRFDHPDSASSLQGDRYRDNVPPSGDHQYARGYYGSDYGRGQHPSFYRGGHPNGRGYGRGYY